MSSLHKSVMKFFELVDDAITSSSAAEIKKAFKHRLYPIPIGSNKTLRHPVKENLEKSLDGGYVGRIVNMTQTTDVAIEPTSPNIKRYSDEFEALMDIDEKTGSTVTICMLVEYSNVLNLFNKSSVRKSVRRLSMHSLLKFLMFDIYAYSVDVIYNGSKNVDGLTHIDEFKYDSRKASCNDIGLLYGNVAYVPDVVTFNIDRLINGNPLKYNIMMILEPDIDYLIDKVLPDMSVKEFLKLHNPDFEGRGINSEYVTASIPTDIDVDNVKNSYVKSIIRKIYIRELLETASKLGSSNIIVNILNKKCTLNDKIISDWNYVINDTNLAGLFENIGLISGGKISG